MCKFSFNGNVNLKQPINVRSDPVCYYSVNRLFVFSSIPVIFNQLCCNILQAIGPFTHPSDHFEKLSIMGTTIYTTAKTHKNMLNHTEVCIYTAEISENLLELYHV